MWWCPKSLRLGNASLRQDFCIPKYSTWYLVLAHSVLFFMQVPKVLLHMYTSHVESIVRTDTRCYLVNDNKKGGTQQPLPDPKRFDPDPTFHFDSNPDLTLLLSNFNGTGTGFGWHLKSELGTRQFFRFVTMTMRQRKKTFATSDNVTNFSLREPWQRVLRQRDSNNYILAFSHNRLATIIFSDKEPATTI